MFDHPVLDIAIGLTFIFLLYSLLATSINELLATIFSYRPRMLELAIERMLDGRSYSYYWWDKLANFIFFIWHWIAYGVRYLFKYKIKVKSSLNPVQPAGFKSFFQRKSLSETFIRRKLNSKAELYATNFINHPLYKRAAENSILSKKPAYLDAATFSDILLDILSPASAGPVLLSDVANHIEMIPVSGTGSMVPDTKKILKLYLNQANGDMQRFKLLLEDWYNDTMKRVTGWYKRQSYWLLFYIGIALAATFNVDTISIAQKLSSDKVARAAMVKSASDYIAQNTTAQPNTSPVNTTAAIDTAKINKGIREIRALYEKSIAKENTALGLGWTSRMHTDSLAWQKARLAKQTAYDFPAYFILHKLPLIIAGLLITALAISLGAPFWFDLLNKFVNLRVSGKKPDSENAPASKTSVLNQKPKPNSFA